MVGVSPRGVITGAGVASTDGSRMGQLSQEIVAVLVSAGMPVKMKFVTRGEGAAVAGTGDYVVDGLFLFHANFRNRVAFVFFGVDAGVIVYLITGIAADLVDGLNVSQQGSIRSLKIIVVKGVLTGPQFLSGIPALHEVFTEMGCTRVVVEADFVLNWAVLMDLGLIGKDELVSVLLVLEEIKDAALFHQARNKIESSFAVLYDIL